MGISVSESNTVREMQEHSKIRTKLKNQEIIRKELQYGVPQNARDVTNKENIEETPPIPQPSPSVDRALLNYRNEQLGNLVLIRQKKQISEAENVLSASKIRSNHSIARTPQKQRKEVTQFANKYLNWSKKSVDAEEKQIPTTASKQTVETPFQADPSNFNYQIRISQEGPSKQQSKVKKSKLQRESSISSPNLIMDNRQLVQFENYDWQIPSDKDLLMPTQKIEVLPSMTLVLSNKFNENVGCMDECKDGDQFQKNRRQLMRELLAGKRETPHQKLISCFDFNRPIASQKACTYN